MLFKSETTRSRVPHVSMRDIKVGPQQRGVLLCGTGQGCRGLAWTACVPVDL